MRESSHIGGGHGLYKFITIAKSTCRLRNRVWSRGDRMVKTQHAGTTHKPLRKEVLHGRRPPEDECTVKPQAVGRDLTSVTTGGFGRKATS